MLDLINQQKKIKNEIDEAIAAVIDSGVFIKGIFVDTFEKELAKHIGVKHVISCGNGTDALQIAMMALELRPGDEIILPVFTYAATAEVIALLGLNPVFIDVKQNTFNIDTTLIEAKITARTKAIVPVHLFGQCANMKEIMAIANRHNLYVIEDTAQALGAKWINDFAGGIGHIGTVSFFPTKNLGCMGDGGAIISNNDVLAERIRMIANHGQNKKYYHQLVGVNSRLDSIQAAILSVKLKYLNNYQAHRNKVATWYDEILCMYPKIKTPYRDKNATHVFHQYTIQINENINRDEVRKHLAEFGIESMVYYPLPLHKQVAYKKYNTTNEEFLVADKLSSSVLSLPIHTEMNKEMVELICDKLKQILA